LHDDEKEDLLLVGIVTDAPLLCCIMYYEGGAYMHSRASKEVRIWMKAALALRSDIVRIQRECNNERAAEEVLRAPFDGRTGGG
jgi:hypothetical protein